MEKMYKSWDRAMGTRNPDYVGLYKKMAPVARDKSTNRDAEFWWRFAAVTLGFTNSLNPEAQRTETLAKLQEAKQNAEKAIKISTKHFMANLMMSKVLLEMMTLESDQKKQKSLQAPLVKHLKECTTQKPNLWQVILLECQMHILLKNFAPKNSNTLSISGSSKSSLVLHKPRSIERKLRRILYFAGNSLELYYALVVSLHQQGRINEVLCISMYALKLEQANPKEQYIARMLRRFREKVIADQKRQQGSRSNKTATKNK